MKKRWDSSRRISGSFRKGGIFGHSWISLSYCPLILVALVVSALSVAQPASAQTPNMGMMMPIMIGGEPSATSTSVLIDGQNVDISVEAGVPEVTFLPQDSILSQSIRIAISVAPTDVPESRQFGLDLDEDTVTDIDLDVALAPGDSLRICLPATDALVAQAAAGRELVLLHSPDDSGLWEVLDNSDYDAANMRVCGDARVFSLFASGYEIRDAEPLTAVSEVILPEFSRAMTDSVVGAVANRMNRSASDSSSGAMTSLTTVAGMLKANERAVENGTASWRQLLGGSGFAFTLPGANESGPGFGTGNVTVWGSGDYRKLSGGDTGSVRWNGDFLGAHVGADALLSPGVLAGLALSRTDGKFDYTDRVGAEAVIEGKYRSRMTSIHPYMGWAPREGSNVWATAGWGKGKVEITEGVASRQESDSEMWSAAVGGSMRGMETVRTSGRGAGLEDRLTLDFKSEAWITRFEQERNNDGLRDLKVDTWRARLAAEWAYSLGLPGASVTPLMEMGIRWDGGDGETGGGIELGGGLDYANPSVGLRMGTKGRVLVAHQGNADGWSLGGWVHFGADSGRGLSFQMLPSYGETRSSVENLWERTPTSLGEPVARLDTEIGYGLTAFTGLMKPYSSVVLSEGGTRGYRVGTRFTFGSAFDLSFEGERYESGIGSRPDHGVTLRGRLRW